MKALEKAFRLVLIAATALFIVRGAGHVPRQLLLMPGDSEITASTVQLVALVPAPQPATPLVQPQPVVTSVPTVDIPLFTNPALAFLGDRSPPKSSCSLLS